MTDTITTDLTPVPSRQSPSVFSSRMDTWLGKISAWTTEANALATGANANKLAAEAAQAAAELAETNAETAETNAETAETNAQGYATQAETARDNAVVYGGATVYDSGTTYAQGDVVYDTTDWLPYISVQGSNTGNDPSSDDGTWWEVLNFGKTPIGGVVAFAGDTVPNNFLELDNSTVLKTSYSNLSDYMFLVNITDTIATSSGTVVGTSAVNGCAYGNSTFVAVAEAGKIAYSSDGDTWSTATSSGTVLGTTGINDVCYGNSVFVCVADDGKIAYSSDGDTWTAATSSGTVLGTSVIYGVCWSGTKFVAVGAAGKIAYSTDGDTWTAASSSGTVLGTDIIYGVTFGSTKFVAVGADGKIAYSTDGDTWTAATDSEMVSPDGSFFLLYDVCYGNSTFVAVGAFGKIIYSSDGDIWTIAQTLSYLDDLVFTAVTYTDGYFIAVGDESSAGDAGNILISEDGKTWMKIEGDYNTVAGDCYAVVGDDNGTFVVGSEDGSLVYGEISSTNLQLRKPPDNTESGLKYIIKYQ